MNLNKPLLAELQYEAQTTRKLLERVPESEFDWQPHEKSMRLKSLAVHIADMVGWLPMTLTTDELDFANSDYKQPDPQSTAELLEVFDQNVRRAAETLEQTSDERMLQTWTLRSGEQVFLQMPRIGVVRSMVLNHIIHHRGQLSVYLRMNNVPIPAIYGPSADENTFG